MQLQNVGGISPEAGKAPIRRKKKGGLKGVQKKVTLLMLGGKHSGRKRIETNNLQG